MHYTVYHAPNASVATGKPCKICEYTKSQSTSAGFLRFDKLIFHCAKSISSDLSAGAYGEDSKWPTGN